MGFGNPVHQIKLILQASITRASNRRLSERRIDGYASNRRLHKRIDESNRRLHERRIDGCTSVESTIVQASNRRLNERRIKKFRYTGCPFSATV